jgi:hypothetical protein
MGRKWTITNGGANSLAAIAGANGKYNLSIAIP